MEESTILTILAAIGTAVSGAIFTLWQTLGKQAKELSSQRTEFKDRADKCEAKHELTQTQLLEVTREVGELKGKVNVAEAVNVKLDGLEGLVENIVSHKLEKNS